MNKVNYFLEKDKKSGALLYLEYDKIKGYKITPKTKIEDAINVNKIVFINPTLREKLIKKKIDIKIRYLLKELECIDDDTNPSGVENTIMEAERLRMMLLNIYSKYLGNTYSSLTLNKINIIVRELKIKLYNIVNKKRMSFYDNLYYLDEDEYKGRGR